MQAIMFRGKLIGYQNGNEYITYRYEFGIPGKDHVMRVFDGLGISESIIPLLRTRGITKVRFKYKGKRGKFDLITNLETIAKSEKRHVDKGGDSQVFMSISSMEKQDSDTQTSTHFIDWRELRAFIYDLCNELGTNKIPQSIFFSKLHDDRPKWGTDAITSCLKFLDDKGDIRTGPNMEIIVNLHEPVKIDLLDDAEDTTEHQSVQHGLTGFIEET